MGPWTPPHHPKRQDGQHHSTTALSPTVNRGGKEPATTGSFIMTSLRWEMIRFGNTVLFQNQLFFFGLRCLHFGTRASLVVACRLQSTWAQ